MMGLNYHNALHEIISGKRKVPKSYIPLLKNTFSLSEEEAEYLSLLIDLQRAKNEEEKVFYFNRVLEFKSRKKIAKVLPKDSFHYFSDHMFLIILALCKRDAFKENPISVFENFKLKLNYVDALDVASKLKKEKILNLGEESRSEVEVYRLEDCTESHNIYKKASEFAHEHLINSNHRNSHVDCVIFNTSPTHKEEIKNEIHKFLTELAFKYQVNRGSGLELVQVSVQGTFI